MSFSAKAKILSCSCSYVSQKSCEGEKAVIVQSLNKLDLASVAGKMMLVVLTAVAEMGRDWLVELTRSGLVLAKMEGKTLGWPSKITPDQCVEIITKYEQGESISALARCIAFRVLIFWSCSNNRIS